MKSEAKHRGSVGAVLVTCILAALLGVALDLGRGSSARFWIDAPGDLALLGVGVAVAVVVMSFGVRLVLGKRPAPTEAGEARDAHA
jgi:hypothetical protein